MLSCDRTLISSVFFTLFITILGGKLYDITIAVLAFCITISAIVFPWKDTFNDLNPKFIEFIKTGFVILLFLLVLIVSISIFLCITKVVSEFMSYRIKF